MTDTAKLEALRPWRCDVTGNPVGTDTVIVGAPPCDCQGCRAADTIATLRHQLSEAVRVMEPAARDVLAERRRQVEIEGWTPEHDDAHDKGEMASAAINYAAASVLTIKLGAAQYSTTPPFSNWSGVDWPWNEMWWKPSSPRRMLVKAGALILAEIERLDRLSPMGEPATSGAQP